MHQRKHQGDAKSQRPIDPRDHLWRDLSWDDLRYFLVSAETGSFRRAAERLGVDSATVTRRIDRLERDIGERLFERMIQGVQLTAQGRAILADVTLMARAGQSILRRVQTDQVKGLVRVAVTEGLGTYWILPKLIDLQQANRQLTVDLRTTMELTDIAKLEADISIQFHQPGEPDLIVRKLGRMHNYPFASKEYRRRFGLPNSLNDARQHRFVQQTSPLLDPGALARALELEEVDEVVSLHTNSSTVVLQAAERGVGIAALPSYALALGAPLVPVDMGLEYPLEILMVYHPDIRRSQRHRLVLDWLVRIFDPAHYPCFRDEFIHPNELVKLMGSSAGTCRGDDGSGPFSGFSDTSVEPADP